jgi:hypothetical protein
MQMMQGSIQKVDADGSLEYMRFYLIDVLAKCRKFKASHCATEVLSPLSKWRSAGAKGDKRNPMGHPDRRIAIVADATPFSV